MTISAMLAVAMCALAAASNAYAGASAAASSPDLNHLMRDVQKRFRDTMTFSAKFRQEIVPAGGVKRIQNGTVYYKKGGRMRWNFSGPEGETIVSDGNVLYTYQPDLNQVLESPAKAAFQSSAPVSFLMGIGRLDETFDVSILSITEKGLDDGLVHLKLVPKGGDDVVEMALEPRTYILRGLRVTDALGDVTNFTFSGGAVNIALDPSLFEFKAPPGVDIVKTPGMR